MVADPHTVVLGLTLAFGLVVGILIGVVLAPAYHTRRLLKALQEVYDALDHGMPGEGSDYYEDPSYK